MPVYLINENALNLLVETRKEEMEDDGRADDVEKSVCT